MDEEYDVIVLGMGLKECILSGLLTSQWTVSRSIEILSEQLLGEISRALKPVILPQGERHKAKKFEDWFILCVKKDHEKFTKSSDQ